ncbi:hypothetical protein ABPG72_019963 [Tetrahymena utriculariae]
MKAEYPPSFNPIILPLKSDISIRAINKIYSQSKKQENSINKKEQIGRPRSLTEEQEKKIPLAVVKNKRLSSREIQKSKALNPNNVFQSTVNTSLIREGLVSRISPTVPKISEKNISERADWAFGMLGMSSDEIKNLIFTDESKLFCQKQGKNFLRAIKGKSKPSKYFRLTQQFNGGLELMAWGAIGFEGSLKLIRIDDRLNRQKYKELLENNLISTGILDDRTLKNDKSEVHQSNLVKSYLSDEGIDVLHSPAQSPDMNPIENERTFFYLKNILIFQHQIMEEELAFKPLKSLQQYLTPPEIKGIIFALVERNHSSNSIHRFITERGFELTRQTVINISKQVQNGEWVSNKSKCGRKKAFTEDEEEAFIEQIKQDPSLPVSQLARNPNLNPNQAARQTINKIMLKNKLRASAQNGAFKEQIGQLNNLKRSFSQINLGFVHRNSILTGQEEKKEKKQKMNTFLQKKDVLRDSKCKFGLQSPMKKLNLQIFGMKKPKQIAKFTKIC